MGKIRCPSCKRLVDVREVTDQTVTYRIFEPEFKHYEDEDETEDDLFVSDRSSFEYLTKVSQCNTNYRTLYLECYNCGCMLAKHWKDLKRWEEKEGSDG